MDTWNGKRIGALDRVDDRIKATLARLDAQVEAGRHDEVGGLNTALNALLASRKVVAGISTWPWGGETIRSFASTLLLPIALWLITRLLGRLV